MFRTKNPLKRSNSDLSVADQKQDKMMSEIDSKNDRRDKNKLVSENRYYRNGPTGTMFSDHKKLPSKSSSEESQLSDLGLNSNSSK